MYVDTRLHLQTTPLVEHRLPVLGRTLRDLVLDEIEPSKATEALRDFRMSDAVEEAADWKEGELDRDCAQVCTLLDDHLQALAHAWVTYLQAAYSDVQRATQYARRQATNARVIRAQYRKRNPQVVDQELRQELERLRIRLEKQIDAIRERPPPDGRRSFDLEEACASLKRKFVEGYGHVPTRDLVRCRTTFESCVRRIELAVSKRFLAAITQILE